jgi:hypothetical protein
MSWEAPVSSPVPAGTEREALARALHKAVHDADVRLDDDGDQPTAAEAWESMSDDGRGWWFTLGSAAQDFLAPFPALKASVLAAAVVSSSPATPACDPEGWGDRPWRHALDSLPDVPASPAETREGREALARQIESDLAEHYIGEEGTLSCVCGFALFQGKSYQRHRRDIIVETLVRAASPAVSLPGEAELGVPLLDHVYVESPYPYCAKCGNHRRAHPAEELRT